MFVKTRRGWELPESAATPEAVFRDRRRLCQAMPRARSCCAGASLLPRAAPADTTADPSAAALSRAAQRPLQARPRRSPPRTHVTTYNNYYEFGSSKDIVTAAARR